MESRAKTAVYKHLEEKGHWDNNDDSISILAVNPSVSEFVLQVQETILIYRDKRPLVSFQLMNSLLIPFLFLFIAKT